MTERVFPLVLIAFACASLVHAQSFKATLVGTVVDTSKAAVPAVTATQQDTGGSQSTTTGQDGSFTLLQLAPGRYEVSVELTGFRRFVQSGLVLETDQVRRLAVELQVGSVAESMTVTASVPVVNTDTSSKGELITNAADRGAAAERPELHRPRAPRPRRLSPPG